MEAVEKETNEEYRVQVTSKKQVTEQLEKYKEVLKTALKGQTEEVKEALLQELLAVSPSLQLYGHKCIKIYNNNALKHRRGKLVGGFIQVLQLSVKNK